KKLVAQMTRWRILILDRRSDRVTEPSNRPETGEECEEGGRRADAERRPLRLVYELAITQVRSDPETVAAVDVLKRYRRVEVQRSMQKARQSKRSLPIDVSVKGLSEDSARADRRVVG